MTFPQTASDITTAANALASAFAQLQNLLRTLMRLRLAAYPGTEYENLRLTIVLDIRDRDGSHAILSRQQRVRFLVPDTGVIRDLVWGEGDQFAHYHSPHVKRLMVRPEGSRSALMLGLSHRPAKGEQASIHSRRVIEGALSQSMEYCEMLVERPTRYLALTVLFPRSRPPHSARVVIAHAAESVRRVSVRYGSGGRPYLRWSCRSPVVDTLYSLRWSW
jgi:hypothetical protein